MRSKWIVAAYLSLFFLAACSRSMHMPPCECPVGEHEHDDYLSQSDLDAHHHDSRYVNEGQTDSITGLMVMDGALSDPDVAANAAIAGTKILASFGPQDVTTEGGVGIGVDEPDFDVHISAFGPSATPEFGEVSQPTVLVENPADDGSTDAKYPGVVVANFGPGHPYIMQANAQGSKDAPEAMAGLRTIGAWLARAYNGQAFEESARLSFVAEQPFAVGHNPTAMVVLLGDDDPQTPDLVPRMVITSTGAVGVGTEEPKATLDVDGFAKLRVNSSPPASCDGELAGSVALTSVYRLCACNGTSWAFTHDGSPCQW